MRWFGGSKVMGANGEPLVVYHGTRASFDEFRPKGRKPDFGFHFGDLTTAESFAGYNACGTTAEGGNVIPAYLRIVYPLRVNDCFGPLRSNVEAMAQHLRAKGIIDDIGMARAYYAKSIRAGWRVLQEAVEQNGYDGLVYRNEFEGGAATWRVDSYVVFRQEQVRFAVGIARGGASQITSFGFRHQG